MTASISFAWGIGFVYNEITIQTTIDEVKYELKMHQFILPFCSIILYKKQNNVRK